MLKVLSFVTAVIVWGLVSLTLPPEIFPGPLATGRQLSPVRCLVQPGSGLEGAARGVDHGGGTRYETHPEQLVLGDPFDGSAWAYALHGVPMVFPAPLADDPDAQLGPDRMYLYTSMNRYGFDPEVARLVDELEVRWVVVGTGVVGGPGRPPGFIGLRFCCKLRSRAHQL